MKALTICQPYAALIALPDDHPRAKRVENRSWPTSFRGRLAIHAGKSRNWLEDDDERPGFDTYGFRVADLPFGAIVATCKLVDCVRLELVEVRGIPGGRHVVPEVAARRRPWLVGNEHVEGPWCWVLAEVEPLPKPVPWRGAQGMFDVPDHVLEVRQ